MMVANKTLLFAPPYEQTDNSSQTFNTSVFGKGQLEHHVWSAGVASLQVLALLSSFIAALLGNLILLYAYYRSPQVRTLNNMLTVNLAVADVFMALVVMPAWMAQLTRGGSESHTCQCLAFITVTLALTSICSLAAISMDRYLLICHPFDYPQALTYRRVLLVLVYIWLHSLVLASLPLVGWGHYSYIPAAVPFCGPSWKHSLSYTVVMLVLGFLLPLLIMLISYTQVFRAANSQAKRIEQIQMQITHPSTASLSDDEDDPVVINLSRRRSSVLYRLVQKGHRMSTGSTNSNKATSISRNMKTIRTVFIVVGAFSLCWSPYVIVRFWSVLMEDKPAYSADFVTTWLALSASAINPYVFIFLNRDLRYTVRLVLARMEACLPGHDDAPAKVRLSYYGESIVDSARIASRSADSGVDLEAAAVALAAEATGNKPTVKQYESHLKPPGRAHLALRDSRGPAGHTEQTNQISTDVSNLSSDRVHETVRRTGSVASRPQPPTVAHRGSIPIIILPPED